MKRIILAIWMLITAAACSAASAQDCLVKQAADAAVQRQIAMLDAAKVNPSEFFSGANSCISPMLLQKIDLSKFIPSVQDFLSSGAQSMINNLIQQAQAQVCQILNQQLSNLVSRINSAGSSFQSQLGSQLAGLLGGQNAFNPIQLPGVGLRNPLIWKDSQWPELRRFRRADFRIGELGGDDAGAERPN